MKRIKRGRLRKSVTALAVATLTLLLTGQSMFSQGVVAFSNRGPFIGTGDQRVYDPVTCAPLVGTNWVAALYFGVDADNINNLAVRSLEDHSLLSAIARFRDVDPTSPSAGTWSGGLRFLLGVTVSQTLAMQVRVWDLSKFATFDDANAMGGYAMESAPFSYLVPAIPDGSSLTMNNFQGIAPPGCIPEPSACALTALGIGVLIAGRCKNQR